MEIGEIFGDAFKYPISDFQKMLIVGVLYVICNLGSIFKQIGFYNSSIYFILSIVGFIISFILFGYGLSIIKASIDLDDIIPELDLKKNLVDGIKYFVVIFVYYIIPTIITIVIGLVLGAGPFLSVFSEKTMAGINAATTSDQIRQVLSSVPQEAWVSLFAVMAIVSIIAIILFIIFGTFAQIAVCRLAKYEKLGEAFSVGEIWEDLKEIGFFKVLAVVILSALICTVIHMVLGILGIIPIIGVIIICLIASSFTLLFSNRVLGLLYSEI